MDKLNKQLIVKIAGIVLFAIGALMFASSIYVGTSFLFSFKSGAGTILLLMGIDFVLMIARPEKIFDLIMAVLAIILCVIVIKNVVVGIKFMSLTKMLGILVCMFGGVGLILRSKTMK